MEYRLIRDKKLKRSVRITVDDQGVTARAPEWMPVVMVERVIRQHEAKLRRMLKKREEAGRRAAESRPAPFTDAEMKALIKQAKAVIPERAACYAERMGVSYGRVTIRSQRTRWGSCSSKGNLNFNCLLMLAPPEVLDSVVIHELCHRFEMNHSDRFYSLLARFDPAYREHRAWLLKNGRQLMARLPEK